MAKRFDKHQIEALMAVFGQQEHLTKQKKIEVGTATGLDVEQVASWFSRKRAEKRAKESVGDLKRLNAALQQSVLESQEREAKLQKELQESKRREAELGAENEHLRQELGMCGGYSQFDPMVTAR